MSYGQSPCTQINQFAHRLFCESKTPRSLIAQQKFFEKLKKMQRVILFWGCNT